MQECMFFQKHLFREASYIYATQCAPLCIEGKEPERSVSKPKEYNNESTKKVNVHDSASKENDNVKQSTDS